VTKLLGPPRCLLRERHVAEGYGVCVRTINRWGKDPAVGFPPVIIIRKRRYRDIAALDAGDRARPASAERYAPSAESAVKRERGAVS
jgi:hypothetical protein